jgi:hypothetical protein
MATWHEFVRTNLGHYFLQVFDVRRWPRHGFALYDGEDFWPGGIGLAEKWETVEECEVPEEVRREMLWATRRYNWIKTELGQYMVQVWDRARWPNKGYALIDGSKKYPSGYGLHVGWTVVPADEVPDPVRREVEVALEKLGV